MPNLIIPPRDLPDATEVFATDSLVVDNGATVSKATPVQIVDAGRAWATIQEAQEGTIANKSMSPLTTAAAITSQVLEQFGSEYMFADYAAALAGAPDLDPSVRIISADVGGVETRWIREAGGTALGGGWSPATNVTVRAFNGSVSDAHATGEAVSYQNVFWPNDAFGGYFNMFGANAYRTAMHDRVQVGRVNGAGTVVANTTDPNPIVAYQKFSTANRTTNPLAWDQVGYFGLHKSGGDAFGAALTGYARGDAGSGDIVGVHGRAEGRAPDSEPFGGWSYVLARPAGDTGFIREAIGHEIDFVNRGSSATFTEQFGTYRGLIIATADNSLAGHIALDVKKGTSGLEGWLVGARLDINAVEPSATKGDTKQLYIGGASATGARYGGISFEGGFFTYGIDTTKMTGDFTNNVFMSMRPGERIAWIDGGVIRRISFDTGTDFLNIQNMGVGVNGVRVLTSRRTGWTTDTGTAKRTTNATYSATAAATYSQADVQALMNAVRDLSQTVKALKDDLFTHGLIGN